MPTNPNSLQPSSDSPKPWPVAIRTAISFVLIAHFGMLTLNYVSNNSLRRSDFADKALIAMQPYLITLGWYTELAPVSLVTGETFDQSMTIEYKTNRRDTNWTTWVDSKRSGARWRRMVALVGALADHDDADALGLIAHSLVTRASQEGKEIQRIRFAMKIPSISNQPEAIYEASVIKLNESDMTLIPQIEPTRSVPAITVAKGIGN